MLIYGMCNIVLSLFWLDACVTSGVQHAGVVIEVAEVSPPCFCTTYAGLHVVCCPWAASRLYIMMTSKIIDFAPSNQKLYRCV